MAALVLSHDTKGSTGRRLNGKPAKGDHESSPLLANVCCTIRKTCKK